MSALHWLVLFLVENRPSKPPGALPYSILKREYTGLGLQIGNGLRVDLKLVRERRYSQVSSRGGILLYSISPLALHTLMPLRDAFLMLFLFVFPFLLSLLVVWSQPAQVSRPVSLLSVTNAADEA